MARGRARCGRPHILGAGAPGAVRRAGVRSSWSVTEGHHQLWCVVAPPMASPPGAVEREVGGVQQSGFAHQPLGVGLASAGQARWQSHRAGARAADVSAEADRMHQILNGPEAAQR